MTKSERIALFILSLIFLISGYISSELMYGKNRRLLRMRQMSKKRKIGVHEKTVDTTKHFDVLQSTSNETSDIRYILNSFVSGISKKYSDYDVFISCINISSEINEEYKQNLLRYISSSLSFMLENINKPVIVCFKEHLDSVVDVIPIDVKGVFIYNGSYLSDPLTYKPVDFMSEETYKELTKKYSMYDEKKSTKKFIPVYQPDTKYNFLFTYIDRPNKFYEVCSSLSYNEVEEFIDQNIPVIFLVIDPMVDKSLIMEEIKYCVNTYGIKPSFIINMDNVNIGKEAVISKLLFLISNLSDNDMGLIEKLMNYDLNSES